MNQTFSNITTEQRFSVLYSIFKYYSQQLNTNLDYQNTEMSI